MRRTLEQFYYWTVVDTTAQDQNQVVCHGTRSSDDPEATGRVVMVDQLWMWILDRTKPLDQRPEVVAIFGSAISDIVSERSLASRNRKAVLTIILHQKRPR